jgi:hypothetical protein
LDQQHLKLRLLVLSVLCQWGLSDQQPKKLRQ